MSLLISSKSLLVINIQFSPFAAFGIKSKFIIFGNFCSVVSKFFFFSCYENFGAAFRGHDCGDSSYSIRSSVLGKVDRECTTSTPKCDCFSALH